MSDLVLDFTNALTTALGDNGIDPTRLDGDLAVGISR